MAMKWITQTNAFPVKDAEAFLDWAGGRLLDVHEIKDVDGRRQFWLGAGPKVDSWRFGAVPNESVDHAKELSTHLPEGEVAAMFYAGGSAALIHWDGLIIQHEPEDIPMLAAAHMCAVGRRRLAEKPAQAVVAFGEEMSRAVDYGEPLSDDLGGIIKLVEYPTAAELQAYLDAVEDGVGYMDYTVAAGGGHTHEKYLEALRENPGLDFKDWYNQNLNQYSEGDDLSNKD